MAFLKQILFKIHSGEMYQKLKLPHVFNDSLLRGSIIKFLKIIPLLRRNIT
jgi:hypothetical protein